MHQLKKSCNNLSTVRKGRINESSFLNYLYKRFGIIQINYLSRYGEIDFICFDYNNNQIVFVEAKSSSYNYGLEVELLLTKTKLNRLIKTIKIWLCKNPMFYDFDYRIDYIAQQIDYQTKRVKNLNHYKNIGNF